MPAERLTPKVPRRRRHRCEITADRIAEHLYDPMITDLLSGAECDLLSDARALLLELAETRIRRG